MANLIAYVLSKNTYPTANEAGSVATAQGTQIVYATTSTLTTSNKLFTSSKSKQPVYGDGTSWYGVHLLTDTTVDYVITINNSGTIVID
jgi:hypothetical protein